MMELDIYWTTLLVLLPTVVLLTGKSIILRPFRHIKGIWERIDSTAEDEKYTASAAVQQQQQQDEKDEEARKFRRTFLQVYLLVMGSEWLQGPYLYAVLRDDKNLTEATVAALYATGYCSAAVSCLVTGFLADRYGRRAACLAFCMIHSLACLTVLSDSQAILFLGRVLAGIALTLLWTVFESWMVTEFISRDLEGSSVSLSAMFGIMTTANCLAAILGGILGHCIVLALGSKTYPFVSGIVLEGLAAFLMLRYWNENYGTTSQQPADDEGDDPPSSEWVGGLGDCRIWVLSYVTCCFEGTTFLVIFFWPSALQNAHDESRANDEIPYGVIFATFMACMVLGALTFNACSTSGVLQKISPAWLLFCAIFAASCALLLLSLVRGEIAQFCCFLLFEVCNGVYVPCIAYIRGMVVGEKNRAGLYGLMKIPLFMFVILALGITAADSECMRKIFLASALCLFSAALILFIPFLEFPDDSTHHFLEGVPDTGLRVKELGRKQDTEIEPSDMSEGPVRRQDG